MTTTTDRYIAFIDILGFKDFVNRNSHETVLTKLNALSTWIENIKTVNEKEEVKINFKGAELIPYIFSDSIMIFTNDNSDSSAKLLLYACQYLFVKSLSELLPIKGVIAYGKITVDKGKSIFFGQPIIDAYLLQEELKYYGLILHDSTDRHFNLIDNEAANLKGLLIKIKTPTKSGSITYNNLKPKLKKSGTNDGKSVLETLEELYNHVSGSARIYVDNTIEMYTKIIQT